MSLMVDDESKLTRDNPRDRRTRTGPPLDPDSISMRELTKLTAEQMSRLDHPVPVTNNGVPIAWLVPMTPGERRRAEMIADGEMEPAKRAGLAGWQPLPALDGVPALSDVLHELRTREST